MRDLRLDFFRGLAIYMIFVDHVAGDPLRKFTYQMIGFSDAAELFVFVSGLACGIAYSRMFERHGLPGLTRALAKRVGRIYLCYAVSSVAMILIVAAAVRYAGLQDPMGFGAAEPGVAISSALSLSHPPPLSSILVLYIIFTSMVVPAIILAGTRHRTLALTASGIIWLISQVAYGLFSPLTHALYFNPLAWQFLFAIGVALGMDSERAPGRVRDIFRQRWLLVGAWTVALGALATRILSFRSGFDIAALRLDPATAVEMKEHLSIIRLVHFLGVAYLVAYYVHRDAAFLKWRITQPVIRTGMHALVIFCLSIILNTMINALVSIQPPSLVESLALDSFCFLLMGLAATALTYWYAAPLPKSRSNIGPVGT